MGVKNILFIKVCLSSYPSGISIFIRLNLFQTGHSGWIKITVSVHWLNHLTEFCPIKLICKHLSEMYDTDMNMKQARRANTFRGEKISRGLISRPSLVAQRINKKTQGLLPALYYTAKLHIHSLILLFRIVYHRIPMGAQNRGWG